MAEHRVISRYVKSLLGLAEERNVLEEVHNDLVSFVRVCDENKLFIVVLKSPIIRNEKKTQIIHKLFEGRVNALTLAFMDIVVRKNRDPLLYAIAKEFHNAYNIKKGIEAATVTTQFKLDTSLRAEIERMVKQISGKERIELHEKVDTEMVGGFVLKVGDRQVDASLKSKLKELRIKFSQNPYAKAF
jgi:F-type H+-transporting ATPase subunit delta